MRGDGPTDLARLVEADRVHRSVYSDPAIFDLEMEKIFETVWLYCGHESQVPKRATIGGPARPQPMVMVRHPTGDPRALQPLRHRGAMLCGNRHGNTGKVFHLLLPFLAIQHRRLRSRAIRCPRAMRARASPRQSRLQPEARGAGRQLSRLRLRSLAPDGPTLREFLGDARVAFDDMCDRAPEGEVEIVPNCFRVIQQSNWKIFLENQLDALHPSVTHESTGRAPRMSSARSRNARATRRRLSLSLGLHLPFHKWTRCRRSTTGRALHPARLYGPAAAGPDTLAYEAACGNITARSARKRFSRSTIHHVLLYPGFRCSAAATSCARCGRWGSAGR